MVGSIKVEVVGEGDQIRSDQIRLVRVDDGQLTVSGSATNSKTLGCLCFQSDPITATLNTDKTGYVSGELVQFDIEVENRSNRDMEGMFLVLKKLVT